MAGVVIKNLTKSFGDVVAVDDLTLEVRDKDLVVLLGPSGCGKTTTLRCIAGLQDPDQGEIYIGDTVVNELPPKDRNIAMVFQSYALYPHMTVYDNIAFPLKMHKFPKDEIRQRVKRTAELLRINHLLDRKPKQLSGGEAQRTALGRSIVREPQVFLMDEPLSNLDAILRIYMRAELKRLQKELQTTTIYVTHDQVEAMTMADRIAIMNHGILQQFATPDDVYMRPENTFVAGFIGSPPMNLIDCTLIQNNGESSLDAGEFALRLSDTIKDIIERKITGSELVLGVRPEAISIGQIKAHVGDIKAEVYVVEPIGSSIGVDLKVGEILLKAVTTPDMRFSIGDEVWISFNLNKIHIFDKKTTKIII